MNYIVKNCLPPGQCQDISGSNPVTGKDVCDY